MISIKGLRSLRIFGIALFDLILSFIGMIILFLILWKLHFPMLNKYRFIISGIILTIPLGIIIHVIFGTNTMLNYYLGLSLKP